MKRYKILFFLLLLCSIQPSWACINDPEDWNNYEGDFENCIDGGELDEVVCTPNHDDEEDGSSLDEIEDDDEGYAWENELPEIIVTPNHDDDDNEGNEGWDWDDEQYGGDDIIPDDEETSTITGNSESLIEYKLKVTDKLVKPIDKMPSIGFKQGTHNTCLFAGLSFTFFLFTQKEINEGEIIMLFLKNDNSMDIINGFFNVNTISGDIIDVARSLGLTAYDNVTDINAAIDDGQVVLTDINTNGDYTHDIIIVGYNDLGYIGYDTDINAGYYTIISSDKIHGTYKVGLKK